MHRWIWFVLLGVFFGIAAILFTGFRNVAPQGFDFEVAKALLQINVAAIVGTVVSLLVFEYQRKRQALDKEREHERKKLEYRETLLLSILSRAMEAYGQAKKTRRLLRGKAIVAHGANGGAAVLADQYDFCFELFNDAQISLENLARDVDTSEKAFSPSKAGELIDQLRKMDAYLNDMIGEFEHTRNLFSGAPSSLPLVRMAALADFILPASQGKFRERMIMPYHRVQAIIRAELLHPNLPDNW